MSRRNDPFEDIPDEGPEDWVSTDHPRVFYRSRGNRWDLGEFQLGKFIAKRVPEVRVVITMGPYRGYDFAYEVYPDGRIIHIDCYSPAFRSFGSDVLHRPHESMIERLEAFIAELLETVEELREDGGFELTDRESDE